MTLTTGVSTKMNVSEVLFYFMVYAVLGCLLENTYNLATTGRFWKEGFMLGPYKPMYGVAPLLLLGGSELMGNHFVIVAAMCFIVPTAVEYVSGYGLKACFGRTWWDYSALRGQLHGHICLRFSLYWGILSLSVLHYMHPWIKAVYGGVEAVWAVGGPLLFLLFLADFAYTWKIRRRSWRNSWIA